MMIPHRVKVMDNINDNINDKINRLFRIEQLKHARKSVNAHIDSYNNTMNSQNREEYMVCLSDKFQALDRIDLEERKLLEDEG